ncbi:hypothetical protein BKA67DRAFT_12531 [Truncatella angustata]|uniref:RING-type domain-containing protein n=1 Tax=Truncatella angustata TaxID=152316 RepID=A0A9P9A2R9_9PEZI|nr:uncharacterized protein BKA67DRAFT_12531 [Truncatella angustata]KAH6659388.1 hypothetical protein BKA67DRAFT_12531 [Truncatella angustata]
MEESAMKSEANKESCRAQVLLIFEDIDAQYLEELAIEYTFEPRDIIVAILDKQERGQQYPKRANHLKRKRNDDNDESQEITVKDSNSGIKAKMNDPAYLNRMRSAEYKEMATFLISQDFPRVPKTTIKSKLLLNNGSSVFRTYVAMDAAARDWNPDQPLWQEKKYPTKVSQEYLVDKIHELNRAGLSDDKRSAVDEFLAARKVKSERDARKAAEDAERRNLEQARQNGELGECGCCCDEFPLNRMTHCEGETAHWFCRPCMKQQAETTIGFSKYEISCLSMDGCVAGFSVAQKNTFLHNKLWIALNRIEALAMLEAAGIENLETCPFCPMAMEYPPVEENKEFRCADFSCGIVSCRLCRKATHVPKTCAEAAAEEGQSARHIVEEAMTRALVRECNQCGQPYVKEDGCNKITCTRCGTLQCYVCRQTVKDYSHFNDRTRGGKNGQCPLFELSTEERHQNEVRRAEEASRSQVAKDNPELNDEILKLKVSARVLDDEKKRMVPRAGQRNLVRPPAPNVLEAGALRLVRFEEQIEELQRRGNELRQRRDEIRQRHNEMRQRIEHQNMQAEAQRMAARQIHNNLLQRAPAQSHIIGPAPNSPVRPQSGLVNAPQPPHLHQPQRQPVAGHNAANPILLGSPPARIGVELRANLRNDNIFLPLFLGGDLDELRQVDNYQHHFFDNDMDLGPPNLQDRARAVNRIHGQIRQNFLSGGVPVRRRLPDGAAGQIRGQPVGQAAQASTQTNRLKDAKA